jgi:hypothetical protein
MHLTGLAMLALIDRAGAALAELGWEKERAAHEEAEQSRRRL